MPFDECDDQDLFAGAKFLVAHDSHAAEVSRFVQKFGGKVDVPGDGSPPQRPFRWRWDEDVQETGNAILTAEVDGLILLSGWGASRLAEVWSRSLGNDRTPTLLADLDWLVGDEHAIACLRRLQWELPNRSISVARDSHVDVFGGQHQVELMLDSGTSEPKEAIEETPADLGRRVLQAIDRCGRLENTRLAVEVTTCFSPLRAGLESRGARVRPIPLSGTLDAYRLTEQRSDVPMDSSAMRFVVIHDFEGVSWLLDHVEWTGRSRGDFHLVVTNRNGLAGDCTRFGFRVIAEFDCSAIGAASDEFARRLAPRLW
jgi:hypothetical protein